jgi:hypothetical protein
MLALAGGSGALQATASELKRLPDLDLRPASPWADFASVGDWIPFGDGIALLAWHGTLAECEMFLQVYDAAGKKVRELPLPSKEGAALGGGAFHAGMPARLVALGPHEIGVLPRRNGEPEFVGLRCDLEHETLAPWKIPIPIESPSACEVLQGGEFLKIAIEPADRLPRLQSFAPGGEARWTLDRGAGFFAQGGLALASDGRIVAWNSQDPPALQIVSPQGQLLRTVPLNEILPDAPALFGVAAGARGELYLDVGLQEKRRIVTVDAGIRLLADFVRPWRDRSTTYQSMRCATGGNLWIYDGFCFARLDGHGTTKLLLGPEPGAPVLQSARPVHITNDGRVFAFSDRDGQLFELDATSTVLKVIDTYVTSSPFRFEDLEWQMAPLELATRYRWHSFDEGRRLWRIKSTRALLLRADESEVLGVTLAPVQLSEVEARPLAVSRAGLFALQLTGAGTPELMVLDPEGNIRARVPMDGRPVRFVAMDEQRLALTTASSVELYEMSGQHVGHAEIPSDGWLDMASCGNQTDDKWRVDLRPETKELWLRQGPNAVLVRRYALP